MISLNAAASVANVLLMTEGLFLTLGKMILPFFETLIEEAEEDDEPSIAFDVCVDVIVGRVVVILTACGTYVGEGYVVV